jgi:hypothetical protein
MTDREILVMLLIGQENALRGQENVLTKLDRLEKRTGILVEEKARAIVTRMFGSDFSERFLIKSIHDVVKLISKANDPELFPDNHNARNEAVSRVVEFLKPLRRVPRYNT